MHVVIDIVKILHDFNSNVNAEKYINVTAVIEQDYFAVNTDHHFF